jgi:hypothetical protein
VRDETLALWFRLLLPILARKSARTVFRLRPGPIFSWLELAGADRDADICENGMARRSIGPCGTAQPIARSKSE